MGFLFSFVSFFSFFLFYFFLGAVLFSWFLLLYWPLFVFLRKNLKSWLGKDRQSVWKELEEEENMIKIYLNYFGRNVPLPHLSCGSMEGTMMSPVPPYQSMPEASGRVDPVVKKVGEPSLTTTSCDKPFISPGQRNRANPVSRGAG